MSAFHQRRCDRETYTPWSLFKLSFRFPGYVLGIKTEAPISASNPVLVCFLPSGIFWSWGILNGVFIQVLSQLIWARGWSAKPQTHAKLTMHTASQTKPFVSKLTRACAVLPLWRCSPPASPLSLPPFAVSFISSSDEIFDQTTLHNVQI